MSSITPAQLEEITKAVAANRAFQNALLQEERKARRNGAAEFTISLVPSPDDPPPFSAEHQAELESVYRAFRANGIKADATSVRTDSHDAGGGLTGAFLIPLVANPAIGAIVGAFLQAKLGRKYRLKFSDKEIEVEAPTMKELERLINLAVEARSQMSKRGCNKIDG
jgi:hypothetical protein